MVTVPVCYAESDYSSSKSTIFSLSWSACIDTSFKLLLLCNSCNLKTGMISIFFCECCTSKSPHTDDQNGDLTLRLTENSHSISAIQLVALKSLQKALSACIDSRLDSRDRYIDGDNEFNIYERLASILFSPLQSSERHNEIMVTLFGAGTYEIVESEMIIAFKSSGVGRKNRNEGDSSAKIDQQGCIFDRFSSSTKQYYFGVVAKFFQACVQDCKMLLTVLSRQNKIDKRANIEITEIRQNTVSGNPEPSVDGNHSSSEKENAIGENVPHLPEEIRSGILATSQWPFLSALLNMGRSPLQADEEFSGDACLLVLTKIKGTLRQNRMSRTSQRHVVLVKALDELELHLSFLGPACRKFDFKKVV